MAEFIQLTWGAASEPVTFGKAWVKRIERNIQWTSGDSERTLIVESDGNKTWVRESYEEVLALLAGEREGKAEGGYVYKAGESEKRLLADGRALAVGDVTQKLRKLLEEYRNYTDDFVVWRVCEGLNVTLGDLRRLVAYFDGRAER